MDQGSKKGTSKYVSTTKAFDAVVRLAAHTYANSSHYSSQLYVAVINAASSNVAYDLTSPEGREKAGITVGSSGDYFSNKFCEVLLTSPSTAVGKDAVGKGGVDVVAFFDIGPLVNWKRIETDLASTVFQLTGGESKALAGIMTKVKASFRKLPSYVPGPKHLKMVSDASLQDRAKCPGNMQLVRKLRAAREDVVEKGGGSDTVPIRSQVQSILETLKAADGTMVRFVAVWVHHQHGFKGEKGGWFPSLLKLLKSGSNDVEEWSFGRPKSSSNINGVWCMMSDKELSDLESSGPDLFVFPSMKNGRGVPTSRAQIDGNPNNRTLVWELPNDEMLWFDVSKDATDEAIPQKARSILGKFRSYTLPAPKTVVKQGFVAMFEAYHSSTPWGWARLVSAMDGEAFLKSSVIVAQGKGLPTTSRWTSDPDAAHSKPLDESGPPRKLLMIECIKYGFIQTLENSSHQ